MTVLDDAKDVDAQYLADLADGFLAMPKDKRERFLLTAPPEKVDLIERAVGERLSLGWRATPDALAHYLTDGAYRRWAYIRLFGARFRDACDGIDPHQLWMMPSQMGKTTQLLWGIIWLLDRDPRKRIMYVSYDADRAVAVGGQARDIAEGRHPDVTDEKAALLRFRLRSDQRARGAWMTDEGGGLYCVGIQGGITGFPEDVILMDDLIKGWQAAHSPANREFVWNVYRSQIRMRVQSSRDPMIASGTRWHEDDVQARLLASGDDPDAYQWSVVRLPAIAEEHDPDAFDPMMRLPDPLGRAPGQIIEPERFDEPEVRSRAAGLGSYLAAAMEQQRPAPEEGGEIKRAWFRIEDTRPERADEWLSSWDCKLKDKETGDYVAGGIWARTGKDVWLMDQVRGKFNFATTINAVALMAIRWPQCRRHVIENAGNGPEVIVALKTPSPAYVLDEDMRSQLGMTEEEAAKVQVLRRRGLAGITPNNVREDKPTRMRAVSSYIEAGDVHLWSGSDFLGVYLEEMASFPNGTHDDQVDQTSQALAKIHKIRGPRKLFGETLAAAGH